MDASAPTRTLDDLVESLKRGKDRRQPATLLIGAGCSVSAGIPLASGFLEEFKIRFPLDYARAEPKTYANCMMQLAPDERREFIAQFISQARLNWTHICIAELIAAGYFGWILTTNFDSLILRACSLIDLFPPIYDLAIIPDASEIVFPPVAVFHLHGQHTSHHMANTPEELRSQMIRLEPLLKDAIVGKNIVVAGYSGENDPLFEVLANVHQFTRSLYWAARDGKPRAHVSERLLSENRYAFCVPMVDSDTFFSDLAIQLDVFPPAVLKKPFAFLREALGRYPAIPGRPNEGDIDLLDSAKSRVAEIAANGGDRKIRHRDITF